MANPQKTQKRCFAYLCHLKYQSTTHPLIYLVYPETSLPEGPEAAIAELVILMIGRKAVLIGWQWCQAMTRRFWLTRWMVGCTAAGQYSYSTQTPSVKGSVIHDFEDNSDKNQKHASYTLT